MKTKQYLKLQHTVYKQVFGDKLFTTIYSQEELMDLYKNTLEEQATIL